MPDQLTPMMRQYQAARKGLPEGTLLLFRLGDFYEMFFEDAKEAAPILNVALTKRNGVPMCGVPFHSAEAYVAKLLKAGKRVALCDQVGEPKPGRIVEREITQILSPGTVTDLNLLDSRRSNYLAAALPGAGGRFGLALAELTTGEFRATECDSAEALADELARTRPSEIVVPDSVPGGAAGAEPGSGPLAGFVVTPCDGYAFEAAHAGLLLREHFKVHSLEGFGFPSDAPLAAGAAGAVIHYLKNDLRRDISHIRALRWFSNSAHVVLDAATQANLELVGSRGGGRDTSLLKALDRTGTPMGGRRLREWILHPLLDPEAVRARQDLIAALLREPFLLAQVREALGSIRDVERILGRLSQGVANPRDLAALGASLAQFPDLRAHLQAVCEAGAAEKGSAGAPAMGRALLEGIAEEPGLVDLLERAIAPEPPALLRDGGVFREGFDPLLDELRAAATDGRDWIARLQQEEIERTGIKSLKVRYNSVFGYYIEVTKANLNAVPADYQRKQTTASGERFITPALKEMEAKILGADERAKNLEIELFGRLRETVLEALPRLQRTASAIADLDAAASLAETARLFGHVRPVVDNSDVIEIKGGRHPVLDQLARSEAGEAFVPNDTLLNGSDHRLLVITGPNMAGKSTFIRQTALLVLMAQTGAFLPCESARIGVADRIFTRVGASDDLARGRSTFMVEMNETAGILNNATARSLVILDEIGRGTSTFDGIAIAWSVAEYLHNEIRARTLFATHYHELADLEALLPGVKNYNVAVREWRDEIVFLRKIVRGAADKSYGIQVGRLAGLPDSVIARAREILSNLESGEFNPDGKPRLAESHAAGTEAETRQLRLF